MEFVELKPRQVMNYFKSGNKVGMGMFGILYEYDYDSLIKLYYREYMDAYKSKRVRDFKRDIKLNLEMMLYNYDFNRNKRLFELEKRLRNTSSREFLKAIVTNSEYRIGIIEPYYKGYDILSDKIYDFSTSQKKYILEKVREKIFELFEAGIFPLDIKGDNILLNDDMDVKLSDLDGDDVRLQDNDYSDYRKECERNLIEMEYRLLRD